MKCVAWVFLFEWADLVFSCFLVVLHRYADWDLNVKNFIWSWAFL